MVTAVDPDPNIFEMAFDDYLCKPLSRETLAATIDQHLTARSDEGHDDIRRFFSAVSKLDVLESRISYTDLNDHDEYRELKAETRELGARLGAEVDGFGLSASTARASAEDWAG